MQRLYWDPDAYFPGSMPGNETSSRHVGLRDTYVDDNTLLKFLLTANKLVLLIHVLVSLLPETSPDSIVEFGQFN